MTQKGHLQIPVSVRKQFNMKPWQSHDLEIVGEKIIITPAPDADKIRGQLKDNLHAQGFTDGKLRKMAHASI